MTLSFFKASNLTVSRPISKIYPTRMTRSLSISIACAAVAAGASSASAFMAPQTSHVPTLQSRPSSCSAIPRTMPANTIMEAATSASATLLTDMATASSRSGLTEIDDGNFQKLLDGGKAVLIDACAPWCGPCKLIKPVVERAADKWANAVEVVKYDVEGSDVSQLKAKLDDMGVEISALPTLILLKDGQHISSRSGVVTDMDVNTFLSRNLHKARTSDNSGDEQRP